MLKNTKMQTRLLISYALIIAISMAASIAALFMLRSTGANTALRTQQAARADLLLAITSKDDVLEGEKVESAKRNLAAMREKLPIIRSTFKGDTGLVDRIEAIFDETIDYRDQMFQAEKS